MKGPSTIQRLRPPALVFLVAALATSCGGGPPEKHPAARVDTTGTAARLDSARKAFIADSLRDGYHVYRDEAGRPLMEGEMVGGQRYGVWTSYAPSGRVQSRNVYVGGVLNGITTVFHENGVLYYTGDMRKGRPSGDWKFYDADGRLVKIVAYDTSGAIINDRDAGEAIR